MNQIDKFDRKIIQALLNDSKLSYNQLAELTDLSTSACFRRVQAMQELGVIEKFTIQLSPKALRYTVSAFTHVTVNRQDIDDVALFKQMVATEKEILSCHQLSGNTDFLLYICAESIAKYTEFIEARLLALNAVRDVSSSIVLSEIKPYTVSI